VSKKNIITHNLYTERKIVMKHLKRLSALILVFAMVLSLTSCGGDSSATTERSSMDNAVTSTVNDASAPADESQVEETTFEEQIIVDNDDCTFKITGISKDSFSYNWTVYLENKTNKTLMFSLEDVSVDGYMLDPFWAEEVTGGNKSNSTITWYTENLESCGIFDATEVEFTLDVYDSDNWDNYFVNEIFTVYPNGEDNVQYPDPRTAQDTDIVLLDTDDCTMVVTSIDPDDIWGYTVNVYLENKTDSKLTFSIDNASVNGYMCDPFWGCSVAAGKKAYTSIVWYDSLLEENNITEVEQLELPLTVTDYDNGIEYANDTVTVNP
jgi:hypothetical protein